MNVGRQFFCVIGNFVPIIQKRPAGMHTASKKMNAKNECNFELIMTVLKKM